jgi:hypothetical protein
MNEIQKVQRETLTTQLSNQTGVGSVTWPTTWPQNPYRPVYPAPIQTFAYPPQDTTGYANEVEVERNEHDATLRFYRVKGTSKSLVKEITVPLSLLGWLQSDA